MAATYVVIGDLDRTFTTATHPTLVQVNIYLVDANQILSDYLASETKAVNLGGLKQVGKSLVENFIHNRKVKDNIPGYQFLKPEGLTVAMKDMLLQDQPWASKFSMNPGNSGSFI